jgi:hypothetical protein
MAKAPQKPQKRARATVDGIFDDGLEGLGKFVACANTLLDRDGGNAELASTLATTLVKLSQVQAEHRKAAAEERKRLAQLTPAMVLAWFRTLSADDRRQVVREVQAMDARGSGLA